MVIELTVIAAAPVLVSVMVRVAEVAVSEGQRVTPGQVLVRLATTDTDLSVSRAQADRAQAVAQLKLLEAGARVVADLYTDSLGDPPVDSYEGVIRWDTERIVEALR